MEMKLVNKPADDISNLAHRLAGGYFSYKAILDIAENQRSDSLAPAVIPGQIVPIGTVGGKATFHFLHYLREVRSNPELKNELERIWFIGSFLTLADELQKHKYLNHQPELEMIYHIRNGIAHGNKFNITKTGLDRLAKHPAHTHNMLPNAIITRYEITPNLHGTTVLFDYISPIDILHLLQGIGDSLNRIAYAPLNP